MANISLLFGDLGGKSPARFLIFRDGDVGIAGLDGVKLTAESAQAVIEGFESQGSELVIDYHHMSGKVEKGEADKAPAAGWIRSLEYVEGEGLYAAGVEWTDTAKAEIEAGEFKYISPSFYSDTKTGSILGLHSVALTNRPRTKKAWKLLAAELTGEADMAEKTKPKVTKVDAAEDGVPMPALSPETSALAKLADKLGLSPDATMEDVLLAALSALPDATPETPDEDVPDESENKPETAEMKTLRAKAANADELASRLAKIEADMKAKRVAEAIEGYIAKGVINPHNAEQVKAATALAQSDEVQFEAVFGSMPAVCKPGSLVNAGGGNNRAPSPRRPRAELIAKAADEFYSNGLEHRITDLGGWVNGTLIEAGLPRMTDDESATLG